METGTVLDLPETERVDIHWHAWRRRESKEMMFIGVKTCMLDHKQTTNKGLV